ncbi:MAG: hypothetical protein WEA09_01470 [Gemmatimonadota bacterium]
MRTLTLLLVSFPVLACAGDTPAPADEEPTQASAFQDADVQRIHSRMMEAMAPGDRWNAARYLEFDWMVARGDDPPLRRSHRLDRWEGRVRVDAPTSAGPMMALFPLDDPSQGRVWLDGEEQMGEGADTLLARANSIHINDAYWLLMPYKWTDPGVQARFLGAETTDDGREWEVVELSFQEVGLTPQNVYRAFINPASGLMERWHYLANQDADPSPSDWTDWTQFGPIRLSVTRTVDGVPRIYFENVRVETEVPEGAFAPPGS